MTTGMRTFSNILLLYLGTSLQIMVQYKCTGTRRMYKFPVNLGTVPVPGKLESILIIVHLPEPCTKVLIPVVLYLSYCTRYGSKVPHKFGLFRAKMPKNAGWVQTPNLVPTRAFCVTPKK